MYESMRRDGLLPWEARNQTCRISRVEARVVMKNIAEHIEKQERDQERWQQTLDAMEPAAQGKVVDASVVHS
jgi:hypothetical protein